MKKFIKIIASFALVLFATTFVAFESHGSSLCSSDEVSHVLKIASDSSEAISSVGVSTSAPESHSQSTPSCHCAHSANCSVVLTQQILFSQIEVNNVDLLFHDKVISITSESLIKPPRA